MIGFFSTTASIALGALTQYYDLDGKTGVIWCVERSMVPDQKFTINTDKTALSAKPHVTKDILLPCIFLQFSSRLATSRSGQTIFTTWENL